MEEFSRVKARPINAFSPLKVSHRLAMFGSAVIFLKNNALCGSGLYRHHRTAKP
jgi:hypothetical protein